GEEKENLMSFCKNAKIDDKVFFLGFQENPWIYLNNADVYISASLSEGVSRSVMEALFFGKFCSLSNIPGHFELIKVGENGLLFNSDDELKENLKYVLLNKEKFKMKRSNLLPYEFSKERNVMLLRKFIKEKILRR
ncbi:MAG: glycosyltransferase, partial [Calditerrivibrio sp.]|nr:glycosyltransferase [Calditerrivibrio sp.]